MDSLGLGVFTVMGIQTALSKNPDFGRFLLVSVAVLTGIGGGVLRDVMAGERPYVFVKHFLCLRVAYRSGYLRFVKGYGRSFGGVGYRRLCRCCTAASCSDVSLEAAKAFVGREKVGVNTEKAEK